MDTTQYVLVIQQCENHRYGLLRLAAILEYFKWTWWDYGGVAIISDCGLFYYSLSNDWLMRHVEHVHFRIIYAVCSVFSSLNWYLATRIFEMYHILSLYDTLWHPNCIFWNGSACHVCQSFVTLSGDDNIRLRTPSTLFQNADKGIFRADKVLKLSCEGSMALCECAQTMSSTDLSNASILVNFASRRLSLCPCACGVGRPEGLSSKVF